MSEDDLEKAIEQAILAILGKLQVTIVEGEGRERSSGDGWYYDRRLCVRYRVGEELVEVLSVDLGTVDL